MRLWRLLIIVLTTALAACQQAKVPDSYTQRRELPLIYPDYVDVTVPVNIAPLCFEVLFGPDEAVTRFSTADEELVCSGLKTRPGIDDWHRLTASAQGGSITVEVFAKIDSQWMRFKPFCIHVSPDSIDAYMSYRMISPSYVSYEELTINQRCLENFDEKVVVDNMLCSTESGGQCVNCHSYQQNNPQRMQFHARQAHGGTIIAYDGEMEKIDFPAVYPAWHPSLKLIAYSCNKTMQAFHTSDLNKIEVLDTESSLVVFDIDGKTVTTVEDEPDELEVFPFWSPDGKYLYYCSAHFNYETEQGDPTEMLLRATELKYNIYRRSFNEATRHFGERELVFNADTLGMSATLPRISPDGRWLVFTMGEWGVFHIWHRDADLWMMDLEGADSSAARPLKECNSASTESYHSWSSNGRWMVFSSRRNDGVFTRPFFVHVDAEGQVAKPFELPTQNPDLHRQLLKSYNVPELMRGPVELTPQRVAAKLKEEGCKVEYK